MVPCMASASARVTGPPRPWVRLCGISSVGSIPAVRIAAINSRSAISDLPFLARERERRLHPSVTERDPRQNSGSQTSYWDGGVAGYVWWVCDFRGSGPRPALLRRSPRGAEPSFRELNCSRLAARSDRRQTKGAATDMLSLPPPRHI